MLKKAANGVLASLRSSTYRSVRLASLLAAALLDGLFEHPAVPGLHVLRLTPHASRLTLHDLRFLFLAFVLEAGGAMRDASSCFIRSSNVRTVCRSSGSRGITA